jgi:hypothetical protein
MVGVRITCYLIAHSTCSAAENDRTGFGIGIVGHGRWDPGKKHWPRRTVDRETTLHCLVGTNTAPEPTPG